MFLGIAWNVWAAVIGGVAFAAWQFWPSLSALAGKLKWPSTTTTTATTDRAKAVECIDYLIAFFKDCPEGQALARKCGQHLFDEHTGAS